MDIIKIILPIALIAMAVALLIKITVRKNKKISSERIAIGISLGMMSGCGISSLISFEYIGVGIGLGMMAGILIALCSGEGIE